VTYGFGVLGTTLRYRLQKWGMGKFRIFDRGGRRLSMNECADSAVVAPPGAVRVAAAMAETH
jgi:hypothetical protein